jgi:hypothetical protein
MTAAASISTVELVYQTICPTLDEFDKDHPESRAENANHESNGTLTTAYRKAFVVPSGQGRNPDRIKYVVIFVSILHPD